MEQSKKIITNDNPIRIICDICKDRFFGKARLNIKLWIDGVLSPNHKHACNRCIHHIDNVGSPDLIITEEELEQTL